MENLYYDEGKVILSYLMDAKPSESLIKLYNTAIIKKYDTPAQLKFHRLVYRFPKILYCIDPVLKPKSKVLKDFKLRLDAAFVLLDTSPEGVKLFYNFDDKNRIRLFLKLFIKIILEMLIFPIRLIPLRFLVKYE